MNLRISNQLTMIGSCITIANSTDYRSIWFNTDPLDFGTDLTKLTANYTATMNKAALAASADGGAADVKASAEITLENAAFVLARALANHFKKTGNLERLAKVNLTRTKIVELRNQDLVIKTTEIRDIASATLDEPDAAKRGVNLDRVDALTAAINAFSAVMNTPRGQIVNRSTLLKEVDTDTAALMEQIADIDDLVPQFEGSESGKRFIEAWKRARMIVDSGHGPGEKAQPAPAPTATTPPTN